MTVTPQVLGDVLSKLREVTDGGDALDAAILSAVEGAELIAAAAEAAERDTAGSKPVELAREALGAMRASVVAATVSVRTLEDRRRSHGTEA